MINDLVNTSIEVKIAFNLRLKIYIVLYVWRCLMIFDDQYFDDHQRIAFHRFSVLLLNQFLSLPRTRLPSQGFSAAVAARASTNERTKWTNDEPIVNKLSQRRCGHCDRQVKIKEAIWWHLNSGGDLVETWSLLCLSSAGDGSSWVNITSTCKTCLELGTAPKIRNEDPWPMKDNEGP